MRPIAITLLIISIVLGGVVIFFAAGQKKFFIKAGNDCIYDTGDHQELIKCFNQKVHEIGQTQGIDAALKYANEKVIGSQPYGVVHLLMHIIGRDAYHYTKNIQKGLAYLPKDTFEEKNFINYDGYRHGLFQAFFYENRDKEDPLILIRKACPTLGSSASEDKVVSYRQEGDENCFHCVGHALMYANGNDVLASVAQCARLPNANTKHWCYIGLFMENVYLYSSGFLLYESHTPRPFVTDDAMVSLCRSFRDREQASICSKDVGWAFWRGHYGDVRGALAHCRLVKSEYISQCIRQLMILPIAGFLGDDYEKITEACKGVGPLYEGVCIRAASYGIIHGTAGTAARRDKFCNMVASEFSSACFTTY